MARPCDPARAGDDPAGQGRGHRLPVEPPHGRLPPGPIDIQSGRMMKLRSIASRRVSSMARRPSDPWVTTVVAAVATHTPFLKPAELTVTPVTSERRRGGTEWGLGVW